MRLSGFLDGCIKENLNPFCVKHFAFVQPGLYGHYSPFKWRDSKETGC